MPEQLRPPIASSWLAKPSFTGTSAALPVDQQVSDQQIADDEERGFLSNTLRLAGERVGDLGGGMFSSLGAAAQDGMLFRSPWQLAGEQLMKLLPGDGYERAKQLKRQYERDVLGMSFDDIQKTVDVGFGTLMSEIGDEMSNADFGYVDPKYLDELKDAFERKDYLNAGAAFAALATQETLASIPHMLAYATSPALLAPMVTSYGDQIAKARAEANGYTEPTRVDRALGMIGGVAVVASEKFGADRLFKYLGLGRLAKKQAAAYVADAATTLGQRIGQISKAGLAGMGIESLSEAMDTTAEYLASTVGTAKGVNPGELAAQAGLGAAIGGFGGGAIASAGALVRGGARPPRTQADVTAEEEETAPPPTEAGLTEEEIKDAEQAVETQKKTEAAQRKAKREAKKEEGAPVTEQEAAEAAPPPTEEAALVTDPAVLAEQALEKAAVEMRAEEKAQAKEAQEGRKEGEAAAAAIAEVQSIKPAATAKVATEAETEGSKVAVPAAPTTPESAIEKPKRPRRRIWKGIPEGRDTPIERVVQGTDEALQVLDKEGAFKIYNASEDMNRELPTRGKQVQGALHDHAGRVDDILSAIEPLIRRMDRDGYDTSRIFQTIEHVFMLRRDDPIDSLRERLTDGTLLNAGLFGPPGKGKMKVDHKRLNAFTKKIRQELHDSLAKGPVRTKDAMEDILAERALRREISRMNSSRRAPKRRGDPIEIKTDEELEQARKEREDQELARMEEAEAARRKALNQERHKIYPVDMDHARMVARGEAKAFDPTQVPKRITRGAVDFIKPSKLATVPPAKGVRKHPTEEYKQQLKESIAFYGIRDPIVVALDEGGGLKITDGWTRLQLAKELKLPDVPVVLHHAQDGSTAAARYSLTTAIPSIFDSKVTIPKMRKAIKDRNEAAPQLLEQRLKEQEEYGRRLEEQRVKEWEEAEAKRKAHAEEKGEKYVPLERPTFAHERSKSEVRAEAAQRTRAAAAAKESERTGANEQAAPQVVKKTKAQLLKERRAAQKAAELERARTKAKKAAVLAVYEEIDRQDAEARDIYVPTQTLPKSDKEAFNRLENVMQIATGRRRPVSSDLRKAFWIHDKTVNVDHFKRYLLNIIKNGPIDNVPMGHRELYFRMRDWYDGLQVTNWTKHAETIRKVKGSPEKRGPAATEEQVNAIADQSRSVFFNVFNQLKRGEMWPWLNHLRKSITDPNHEMLLIRHMTDNGISEAEQLQVLETLADYRAILPGTELELDLVRPLREKMEEEGAKIRQAMKSPQELLRERREQLAQEQGKTLEQMRQEAQQEIDEGRQDPDAIGMTAEELVDYRMRFQVLAAEISETAEWKEWAAEYERDADAQAIYLASLVRRRMRDQEIEAETGADRLIADPLQPVSDEEGLQVVALTIRNAGATVGDVDPIHQVGRDSALATVRMALRRAATAHRRDNKVLKGFTSKGGRLGMSTEFFLNVVRSRLHPQDPMRVFFESLEGKISRDAAGEMPSIYPVRQVGGLADTNAHYVYSFTEDGNIKSHEIEIQDSHIGIRKANRKHATGNGFLYVMGHELMHAATIQQMMTNPEFNQALENLRAATEAWVRTHEPNKIGEYGLNSQYEFVAEAMTNRHFANLLQRISMPSLEGQSMWRRMWDTILRFLGVNRLQSTMLNEVTDVLNKGLAGANLRSYNQALTEKMHELPELRALQEEYLFSRQQVSDAETAGAFLAPGVLHAGPNPYMRKAGPVADLATQTVLDAHTVDRSHLDHIVDKMAESGPWMRKIMLGNLTNDMIARLFGHYFNKLKQSPTDQDPLTKLTSSIEEKVGTAKKFHRQQVHLVRRTENFIRTSPRAIVDRLNNLMFRSTMFGVDPSKLLSAQAQALAGPYKQRTLDEWKELRKEWKALAVRSPEAANLFRAHRTFYENVKERVVDGVLRAAIDTAARNARNNPTLQGQLKNPALLKAMKSIRTNADAANVQWPQTLPTEVRRTLTEAAIGVNTIGGSGPYFPLMHEGEWVVEASKTEKRAGFASKAEADQAKVDAQRDVPGSKTSGTRKAADGTYEFDWTYRSVEMYKELRHAKRATAEYKRLGYTTTSEPTPKHKYQFMDRSNTSRIMQTIKNRLEGDTATIKKAKDAIDQAMVHLLPQHSFRKTLLDRKRVTGADPNILGNLATYANRAGWALAEMEHGGEIADRLLDMRTAASDVDVANAAVGQVVQELEERIGASIVTEPGTFGNWAGKYGYLQFLATPSFAIVNATQQLTMSVPHMYGKYGRRGVTRLAAVNAELMSSIIGTFMKTAGGLDQTARGQDVFENALDDLIGHLARGPNAKGRAAMLNHLKDLNTLEASQTMYLADVASRRGELGGVPVVTPALRYMLDVAKVAPSLVELTNRAAIATAVYDLEIKKNRSHEDATNAAKAAVDATQFNYNEANRPRYWRKNDLRRVLTMFKLHPLGVYAFIAQNAMKFSNGTRAEKFEAMRTFLAMTVTHAALAGIAGSLLAEPIRLLFFMIGAALPDNNPVREFMRDPDYHTRAFLYSLAANDLGWDDETARSFAATLTYGAPRSIGMDASLRVGLQSLMLQWARGSDGLVFAMDTAIDSLIGPILGQQENIRKFAGSLTKTGDVARATEYLIFKGLRDPLRAHRFATEGMTTFSGEPIVGPEAMSTRDLFFRAMGFTSNTEANIYASKQYIQDLDRRRKTERSALLGMYAHAARGEEKRRAMERIMRFNRNLLPDERKEYGISRATILRSMKQRAKRKTTTVQGVTFDKNSAPLYQRIAFLRD